MAQRLPSEEQIIAILRDEPMVGSQLRGALGLPKKQKMAFKQMLADMVERGLLKRTSHKEYQLGDGESLEEKVVELGQRKKALFDRLITPGESALSALSEQDIRRLFD
jgi:DNA-binding IclR family transcriptional regulator